MGSTILFRLKTRDFLSIRKLIPKTIAYREKTQSSSWAELELHSEKDVDGFTSFLTDQNCSFSAIVLSPV